MDSKGVFLFVWGKPQYGWMAYHLAMSIKYHAPLLPVHLLTDHAAMSRLRDEQMAVFDKITYTETPHDPAHAKISLYNKLPFDHTLFLDADGLALQNIEKLLDGLIKEKKPFRCFVHAFYNRHDPDDLPQMYWARKSVIWDHYGFDKETLPATQSSVLYIHKCDFTKELYERMAGNYANRIPLENLKERWGGGQPDELYLNIALAQMNYDPQMERVIYFANDRTLKPRQTKHQYYILSLFGPISYVKPEFEKFYDSEVSALSAHFGGLQVYKWKGIRSSKHANKRHMDKRSAMKGNFFRHERFTARALPTGKTLLFTSYFDSKNYARQKELNQVLQANIENSEIDKVYIWWDCDFIFSHPKVVLKKGKRPTYAQMIAWANSVSEPTDTIVIANSDIYFDQTLNFIHHSDLNKKLIALSRWDIKRGRARLFPFEHSQDTWIFRGKINIQGGDYFFGLPGCDNRFAFDADRSGYKVINPAKDIKTYHQHEVGIRTATEKDRTHGDYLPVYITSIREILRSTA